MIFLRLVEAGDGIPLSRLCFLLLACFLRVPLRLLWFLLRPWCRPFLLGALGAGGLHAAALGIVEGGVLGPRARKLLFQFIEVKSSWPTCTSTSSRWRVMPT